MSSAMSFSINNSRREIVQKCTQSRTSEIIAHSRDKPDGVRSKIKYLDFKGRPMIRADQIQAEFPTGIAETSTGNRTSSRYLWPAVSHLAQTANWYSFRQIAKPRGPRTIFAGVQALACLVLTFCIALMRLFAEANHEMQQDRLKPVLQRGQGHAQ